MKNHRKADRLMYLAVFALIVVAMIAMTSCGKSEFTMSENTEKAMTILAENASVDSMFSVGSLEVAEGEEVAFFSNLEKGTIRVEIVGEPENQSADELPDLEGEAVITFNATGSESMSGTVDPGSYMVRATVIEKATGTVTIEVKPTETEQWKTADSPDDAGDKAGVGLFLIDPSGLSLGHVTDADYRYMEGVAEAHFGIAAVELFVRKGLSDIDEGDISFDNNEYKYEWTQDMDGIEVKSFGNREGEATKSIWSKDGYSYAILAYGAGGDDDFGLSADDLRTLFNNIQ